MTGGLVVVTRPEPAAERTAAAIRALGCAVLSAPLSRIAPGDPAPVDWSALAGIVLTSANGAVALADTAAPRTLPVYAVGDATAGAAAGAGFSRIVSAKGDAGDLLAVLRSSGLAAGSRLLHARGDVVSRDLAGPLGDLGLDLVSWVAYRAVPVACLPADLAAALTAADTGKGGLVRVLFFSPRAARTFARLAPDLSGIEAERRPEALCLSAAVASAARGPTGAGVAWRSVRVAARPDEPSLLALLTAPS